MIIDCNGGLAGTLAIVNVRLLMAHALPEVVQEIPGCGVGIGRSESSGARAIQENEARESGVSMRDGLQGSVSTNYLSGGRADGDVAVGAIKYHRTLAGSELLQIGSGHEFLAKRT